MLSNLFMELFRLKKNIKIFYFILFFIKNDIIRVCVCLEIQESFFNGGVLMVNYMLRLF